MQTIWNERIVFDGVFALLLFTHIGSCVVHTVLAVILAVVPFTTTVALVAADSMVEALLN